MMSNVKKLLFVSIFFLIIVFSSFTSVFANDSKQRIYDYANLLSDEEVENLEELAYEHSQKRETDFIIVTSPDADGKDVKKYVQDFYDEMALGFGKPHGNAAILGIDMDNRDFYLAGFYKAEERLDDSRLDLINDKITPYLANDNYYDAFALFIETGSRYIRFMPGVNPESALFNTGSQIFLAIVIALVVVWRMARNSGGKVTVNERTYAGDFKVLKRKDVFLSKNVTKRRKPKNNNNGSGRGGGGGVTRGGHSHSGSRGSF